MGHIFNELSGIFFPFYYNNNFATQLVIGYCSQKWNGNIFTPYQEAFPGEFELLWTPIWIAVEEGLRLLMSRISDAISMRDEKMILSNESAWK